MKITKSQSAAAAKFLDAFNAFQANRDRNARAALDAALDAALADYRKAHNLSPAYGFLDCINHFNNTHATE